LKENQQVIPATETTVDNESENREPEFEIHINAIEQNAIEEEIPLSQKKNRSATESRKR